MKENKKEEKDTEESHIWKIIRRIFLIIIGLFLLILILTTTGLQHAIEKSIVSVVLQDNYALSLPNNTIVVFTEEAYLELWDYYASHQKQEFAVCLYGNLENKTYIITTVSVPETFSATLYQVIFEGCDASAIISLHSHPYSECVFSEQDIASYKKFAQKNPYGMTAIMCEETRFSFYGY